MSVSTQKLVKKLREGGRKLKKASRAGPAKKNKRNPQGSLKLL
jgi:hypothetical protein